MTTQAVECATTRNAADAVKVTVSQMEYPIPTNWRNTLCPICGWWMRITYIDGVRVWFCVNPKHAGTAPSGAFWSIREYKGWKIYPFKEAYHMMPANEWHDLYIAYKPQHDIITGVDIPDLIADIDEAERP